MNIENNPKRNFYPLYFSIILVVGILIGWQMKSNDTDSLNFVFPSLNKQQSKINQLISYIKRDYVDSINTDEILDATIQSMLGNLDPHSAYIPASELAEMNEPLQGNFDGIGIEFNILEDTIFVVTPLSGGPAESLGILAGDRIVSIEGKNVAGVKITNNDVIKKLKGPGGTKVNIEILRRGRKTKIPFTIVRGKIPIYSVDASYIINNNTGYIKISRFATTTYDEFMEALSKLEKEGAKKLILDLRGNPGGLLNMATQIADEFLPSGKLIVYTKGRKRAKDEIFSTSGGRWENKPVAILIDEGSASASEIVAGALQDNDRATIIGRRSYGKGLVQEQSGFTDGSAVRLTIARYYTPTGRCIQKPYKLGDQKHYMEEEMERYMHGELFSKDSIKFDEKEVFTTPAGKKVYGGGGIMPDEFIPLDTTEIKLLNNLEFLQMGLNQYCISYVDKNKGLRTMYKSPAEFNSNFEVSNAVMAEVLKLQGAENSSQTNIFNNKRLKRIIKAGIARSIFRSEGYFAVMNESDSVVLKAVEVLTKK